MRSLRDPDGGRGPGAHVGELQLRRFRLGELAIEAQAAVARHTAECPGCRARLETLDAEQRAFSNEIPFARFAGGVERAARVPRAVTSSSRRWLVGSTGLLAAAAAALLLVRPGDRPADLTIASDGTGTRNNAFDLPGRNRRKGGAPPGNIRIAGADGTTQRSVGSGATVSLAPGDRLRLGYRTGAAAHLVALSIDEAGQVTALYPERGPGLAIPPARTTGPADVSYLPDSLELTGRGRERVYLILAPRPFTVEAAAAAVRAAHAAAGDLYKMKEPALPSVDAEVATWLFVKP
jgi:hypothetical protein